MGIKKTAELLCCPKRFIWCFDQEPSASPANPQAGPPERSGNYQSDRGEFIEGLLQYTLVGNAPAGEFVACSREEFDQRIHDIKTSMDHCLSERSFATLEQLIGKTVMEDLAPSPGMLDNAKEVTNKWRRNIKKHGLVGHGKWARELDCTVTVASTPNGPGIPTSGRCDLVHMADNQEETTIIELKAVSRLGEQHAKQATLYSAAFAPNAVAFLSNNGSLEPVPDTGPSHQAEETIQDWIAEFHSDDWEMARDEGIPHNQFCKNCDLEECEHWVYS